MATANPAGHRLPLKPTANTPAANTHTETARTGSRFPRSIRPAATLPPALTTALFVGMLNSALLPTAYALSPNGPTVFTLLQGCLIGGGQVGRPAAMRATIAPLLQWDHLIEPGQRRGVLEDAYEQSERLLNLVEAQLIIAKLEAGAFQPKPLSVSLKDTAAQVQRVLSSRYGDRVEAVRFQFSAVRPPTWNKP